MSFFHIHWQVPYSQFSKLTPPHTRVCRCGALSYHVFDGIGGIWTRWAKP